MADRPTEESVAWANMLAQNESSPNTYALVYALNRPLTTLASSFVKSRSALNVDEASGSRLDLIASIVGASRDFPQGIIVPFFGFREQPAGRGFGRARMRREGESVNEVYRAPDREFRSIIKLKIALNNSHGTAYDVENAAKAYYNTKYVSVRDDGIASVTVWVGVIPDPDAPLTRIRPDLAFAAGVSYKIAFYQHGATFGFAGQPNAVGFGKGPIARSPGDNLRFI